MKRVAHAPNTIRLPPCNKRQTECTSIDASFLCPSVPLPFTQARQEHVHRACRTRKGFFHIYVCAVYRHVGGLFQPHEPTQMHAHMARKRDIWQHLTPLHTAHTHHNAEPHRTTLQQCCAADSRTSPVRSRSRWPHAPDENISEALPSNFPRTQWRLHHLCCYTGGISR